MFEALNKSRRFRRHWHPLVRSTAFEVVGRLVWNTFDNGVANSGSDSGAMDDDANWVEGVKPDGSGVGILDGQTVISGTLAAPVTSATGATIQGATFNGTFAGAGVTINAGSPTFNGNVTILDTTIPSTINSIAAVFNGSLSLTGSSLSTTFSGGDCINATSVAFDTVTIGATPSCAFTATNCVFADGAGGPTYSFTITDGGGNAYSSATSVYMQAITLGVGSTISAGTFNGNVIADHGNDISGGSIGGTLHMAGGGTFSGGSVAGVITAVATIFTSDVAAAAIVATSNCDFSAAAMSRDITSAGGVFGAHTYVGNQTWTGTQTIDVAAIFSGAVTASNDPVNGTFQSTVTVPTFSAAIDTGGTVTCSDFRGTGAGSVILTGNNQTFLPAAGFTGTWTRATTPNTWTDAGGTITIPAAADTLSTGSGASYGVTTPDHHRTGSYEPDFPARSSVLPTDTVNNLDGTCDIVFPDADNVRLNVRRGDLNGVSQGLGNVVVPDAQYVDSSQTFEYDGRRGTDVAPATNKVLRPADGGPAGYGPNSALVGTLASGGSTTPTPLSQGVFRRRS